MANTLSVLDMIAKEALSVAHETATFIGTTDLQYDAQFKTNPWKTGDTLRVANPNKYTRRQGSRVMDVQDTTETTQNITVATQDGVDMRFNSAELTLDTNNPKEVGAFSKKYIVPAISTLVSGIEADYLAASTKATYQMVGTAGTAMTTLAYPGLARAKMNQQLAPKMDRSIQVDSVTMAGLVNGMSAYFAPSDQIGGQYREGLVKRTSMADYYENERVWTLTNVADIVIDTDADATVTDGGTALAFSTLSDQAQPAGMVFTIAGVYDCHPETKAAYPHLKQFTIVSMASASAAAVISPATYLTGARKNVCSSTGADLAVTAFNAKTMTPLGLASKSYVQPLMYQKEAFQFVTADLPIMDDAAKCVRQTMDGLSLRVWMASDIRNDELLCRIDILYGYAALRPEWACRIIGAVGA